jgi:hypothetical protein
MKNRRDAIDAMLPNLCQPELTTLVKTYPKVYPQKLRIVSEVQALSYQEKAKHECFLIDFIG